MCLVQGSFWGSACFMGMAGSKSLPEVGHTLARGGYAWSQVPLRGWVCLVPLPSGEWDGLDMEGTSPWQCTPLRLCLWVRYISLARYTLARYTEAGGTFPNGMLFCSFYFYFHMPIFHWRFWSTIDLLKMFRDLVDPTLRHFCYSLSLPLSLNIIGKFVVSNPNHNNVVLSSIQCRRFHSFTPIRRIFVTIRPALNKTLTS